MPQDQDIAELLAMSYELGVLRGQERATRAQSSPASGILRATLHSRVRRSDPFSAIEEARLLALEDALLDESLVQMLFATPYVSQMKQAARTLGERRMRAYITDRVPEKKAVR